MRVKVMEKALFDDHCKRLVFCQCSKLSRLSLCCAEGGEGVQDNQRLYNRTATCVPLKDVSTNRHCQRKRMGE